MIRRPALGYVSAALVCLCSTSSAFAIPLFDTGPPRTVQFDATNMGVFDTDGDGIPNLTYLGYSAGQLSAAQPQRWMAQPFVLPATPAGFVWRIDQIDVDYFVPVGGDFPTLTFKIWKRLAGNPAPLAGDLLHTGSAPFAPGIDDPEADANDLPNGAGDGDPIGDDDFLHQLFPTPFKLDAGDYYLTIYGDGGGPLPNVDNAAWLANPADGINLRDGAGTAFAWRSSVFPVPGFAVYSPPLTTISQAPGLDPQDRFNTSFTIYGKLQIIPGPGALAVLGLGLLVPRRRRR